MRARSWSLGSVAGLLAVILWASAGSAQAPGEPTAEERPEVGFLAPDFALFDPGGEGVKLSDLRGKAVFVNFWASWCPACQREMPTMESLYREFKSRGLEILAVSIETRTADVAKFTEMHGVTFPVLLDPDHTVFTRYRGSSIPTHILIDRSGVIRVRQVGARDWSRPETRKVVEAILR